MSQVATTAIKVAAPKADASRVAAVRNSLDLKDRNALEAFGERARREVTAGIERLLAEVRSRDVVGAGEILNEMAGAVRGLETSILTPKGGVAGLFDSRDGRLDRFRSRFDGQWKVIKSLGDDLTERAERIGRRVQALNALHEQSRTYILELDAYLDAGRIRVNEVVASPADHLEHLKRRLESLGAVRRAAIAQLPLVRLVQNTEAPLEAMLKAPVAAMQSWRADWVDRLGMRLERGVRIRPDEVGLEAARNALLQAIETAAAQIAATRTRRAEAEVLMEDAAKTLRKP